MSAPASIVEILRKAAQLCAMARELEGFARDFEAQIRNDAFVKSGAILPASPDRNFADAEDLLACALGIFEQRRLRDRLFGKALLREPCWDMLLDLYVHRLKERRVTTGNLVASASVPTTTALRWIGRLEADGWIASAYSSSDGRVRYLSLTDAGFQDLTTYFRTLGEGMPSAFVLADAHAKERPQRGRSSVAKILRVAPGDGDRHSGALGMREACPLSSPIPVVPFHSGSVATRMEDRDV